LLAMWKSDRPRLLARFDANHDGSMEWQEWQQAQVEARSLAEKKFAVKPAADASINVVTKEPEIEEPVVEPIAADEITHMLNKPTDGRPLLVSKGDEQSLTKSKRWQSRLGLLMFIGGAIGVVWMLKDCVGNR
jgi:hypothetical protein